MDSTPHDSSLIAQWSHARPANTNGRDPGRSAAQRHLTLFAARMRRPNGCGCYRGDSPRQAKWTHIKSWYKRRRGAGAAFPSHNGYRLYHERRGGNNCPTCEGLARPLHTHLHGLPRLRDSPRRGTSRGRRASRSSSSPWPPGRFRAVTDCRGRRSTPPAECAR